MSEALAIVIRGESESEVRWTGAALARREESLAVLAMIGRVSNPDDNDRAVAAQAAAMALKSDTEKARKIMKDPVIEWGRKIDAAAKSFIAPIEAELMRLGKLLGDYQQRLEANRKAEEAARRLEQERIEAERQAEIRRVARLEAEERARLDAEAAKADAARREEIERQKQLAAAQSLERMEAIQEEYNNRQAALPVATEPVRAKGQAVHEEPIIDQIREFELAKARPDLIRRIEFDMISLKRDLANGVKVPGVKFHMETKSTVRGAKAQEAILIGANS